MPLSPDLDDIYANVNPDEDIPDWYDTTQGGGDDEPEPAEESDKLEDED